MNGLGQLVRFPTDRHGINAGSGDNGMFVIMAVPEPEGWRDECMVDVSVVLTEPDSCVNIEHRGLWSDDRDYPDNTTLPMLAALRIGSINVALYDEINQDYWSATELDLTPAGAGLYAQLFALYGVEPVLLTFLDT